MTDHDMAMLRNTNDLVSATQLRSLHPHKQGVEMLQVRELSCAVVLAIATMSYARDLPAQTCGEYGYCFSGGGDHRVDCPGGTGVYNCHFYCSDCVFGECHPGCNVTMTPWQQRISDALQRRLYAASDAMDVVELMRLEPGVRGRVVFNTARSALQVLDCSGLSVVAHLPVNDARAATVLASTLPHASTVGFRAGTFSLFTANMFSSELARFGERTSVQLQVALRQ